MAYFMGHSASEIHGIIFPVYFLDYIRTFTWDKKLETMVKKSGILGGQGKLPTIISPEEYQKRFIEAMHRYFLEVPDHWAGLGKGLEF